MRRQHSGKSLSQSLFLHTTLGRHAESTEIPPLNRIAEIDFSPAVPYLGGADRNLIGSRGIRHLRCQVRSSSVATLFRLITKGAHFSYVCFCYTTERRYDGGEGRGGEERGGI